MQVNALRYIYRVAEESTNSGRRGVRPLKDVRPADIDPAAMGLSLQAMISVTLHSNARGKIRNFIQ